jgi:PKD repeat protein
MNMKHLKMYKWAVLLLLVIPLIYSSCKKEEEAEVIASFTFQVDAANFKMVKFTNTSQNFSTVSWNFGDGSTSVEVSPSHTFAAEGEFTVSMTATSEGGKTDTYAQKITIADPNVLLTRLVGETSKTWKLLRDVSGGVFPMEVGPIDRSTIWWAVGQPSLPA